MTGPTLFLSRYETWRPPVILEIQPDTGGILRRFRQPKDWTWNPGRDTAHWEQYRGRMFLVYLYQGALVFQQGELRFVLDERYSASNTGRRFFRNEFRLYRDSEVVYRFTYRNPQARLSSLFWSALNNDDYWNWDTPFSDVEQWCAKRQESK